MIDHDKPVPPEGYTLISGVEVQRGDLYWFTYSAKWFESRRWGRSTPALRRMLPELIYCRQKSFQQYLPTVVVRKLP